MQVSSTHQTKWLGVGCGVTIGGYIGSCRRILTQRRMYLDAVSSNTFSTVGAAKGINAFHLLRLDYNCSLLLVEI